MAQDMHTLWEEYENSIRKWRKQHPGYAPQIFKFQKRIERLKKEYFLLLVKFSQTKNSRYSDQADAILEQARKEFKIFSKHEIIATLSGK